MMRIVIRDTISLVTMFDTAPVAGGSQEGRRQRAQGADGQLSQGSDGDADHSGRGA
jgi:hypothetical protein